METEPVIFEDTRANVLNNLPAAIGNFETRFVEVAKWIVPGFLTTISLVSIILSALVSHSQYCSVEGITTPLFNVTLDNTTYVAPQMASSMLCKIAQKDDFKIVLEVLNFIFSGLACFFVFFVVKQRKIGNLINSILIDETKSLQRENMSMRQSLSMRASIVPSEVMCSDFRQPVALLSGTEPTGVFASRQATLQTPMEFSYDPPGNSVNSHASTAYPTPYEIK